MQTGIEPPLRLVVSGASGRLGRLLVPRLIEHGVQMLLLGRQADPLREMFPDVPAASYDDWCEAHGTADAFLHLAVLNNDRDAAPEAFAAVNVDFAIGLARKAASFGIPVFVNASSVLALQPWDNSAYARSKRAAAEQLATIHGIRACNLYLPFVLDRRSLPAKLRWLDRLPRWAARRALSLIMAIKPTVDPGRIARFIVEGRWRRQSEIVLSKGQRENSVYRFAARSTDLIFAFAVVIGLWWLLVGIAIAIRLDSPGRSIFAQPRVGKNGRVFVCYKFRTMGHGTAHVATHEVAASAVTRIGAFLRRSKLDELPQIVNLLRGELALIGPRPCLPSQAELIAARSALGVAAVRPGISGLAQIMGVDMSDPERLATYDARYLGIQSLAVDLRVILWTALGKGNADRVRV